MANTIRRPWFAEKPFNPKYSLEKNPEDYIGEDKKQSEEVSQKEEMRHKTVLPAKTVVVQPFYIKTRMEQQKKTYCKRVLSKLD